MVLSKALKAKLTSIPSGVASLSMLDLDWLSGKPSSLCLRSTARCGDNSRVCEAPLEVVYGVVHAEPLVLSLSQWRKIGLPLEVWQESWPNFKGITKGK